MTGRIFNIQKYSLQDGPGIRTTVFLKGCPLRCAWCHNPESVSRHRELRLMEARCIQCGECRKACQYAGMPDDAGPLPLCPDRCVLCGACVDACPTGARQILGRDMTVAEVLREVLRDRVFYEASAGGVTFSGGEPLLQYHFLFEVLSACDRVGLHTAVDTCGVCSTEHLLAIAPLTGLFLYDLKLMDNDAHQRHTGLPNDLARENLEALGRHHANIWVRVPVIPGINDQPGELEAMAAFAASVPGVRQVNLLPYHRLGVEKRGRLADAGPGYNLAPPSADCLEFALQVFRNHGLATQVGG